jgi:hypothetical protein
MVSRWLLLYARRVRFGGRASGTYFYHIERCYSSAAGLARGVSIPVVSSDLKPWYNTPVWPEWDLVGRKEAFGH